ncbi:MAG: hypothetical protein ACJAX1_003311 [Neolewinella sp.]|jgi:hypothetical protein
MLLARRLLTAGFVKKPRQHYGVVYVFCLTSRGKTRRSEIWFYFVRVPKKSFVEILCLFVDKELLLALPPC